MAGLFAQMPPSIRRAPSSALPGKYVAVGESTTNPSVIAATMREPLLPLFVVDRGLRASHDRFGDQCTAV